MSTKPQIHFFQRLMRWRFNSNPNVLTLGVALWLMLSMNAPFWHSVWTSVGGWSNGNLLFLASLPLFTLCWLYLLLSLLAWGRLTKFVLGILMLVSAAGSYFMSNYGIVIDHTMLANVIQTDQAEALELLNPQLVAWMLAFGVAPAVLISRAQLVNRGWWRDLLIKLGSLVAATLCLGVIVMSLYQPYASLIRNHREVRLLLTPSNMIAATHGYLKRTLATPVKLQVVGADAHRAASVALGGKPRVMLVVVGETARAANFSLNGYERPTNPELAKRDVINYPQASSCGTATAVSVPCMFLDVGHDHYKDSMAGHREGLLDILQRAGIQVLWRDNNSGCKGACDRVPYEDVSHLEVPDLCVDGECHDEILLHNLQHYLDQLEGRDAVVVLHMKGSHGPAYYKRYPKGFERFTPVCHSSQLDSCSRESIVNAYDNSLAYTDHVLATTIDLLKSNSDRLDTAMLYLSDHGESLGENGMYLHGVPYVMAPKEQTHIPMLLWLSEGLRIATGISHRCMQQQSTKQVSQDNLFHSVLGLMNVQTAVYQPHLDLFQSCLPINVAHTVDSTTQVNN